MLVHLLPDSNKGGSQLLAFGQRQDSSLPSISYIKPYVHDMHLSGFTLVEFCWLLMWSIQLLSYWVLL